MCFHTRDQNRLHIRPDARLHLFVSLQLSLLTVITRLFEFIVLRGDHNGIDAQGQTLLAVLHGHLRLGIGPQIGHQLRLVLADIGQLLHQCMTQVDGQRHVALRLIGGVAEHHTLIAGPVIFLTRCLFPFFCF